jgi:hypothetical protein
MIGDIKPGRRSGRQAAALEIPIRPLDIIPQHDAGIQDEHRQLTGRSSE